MLTAIVLAAGESRRMNGKNKLLMPFGRKPLIAHVVDQILQCNVDEVIVVLGHEAENVKATLKNLNLKFVANETYQEGMATSIHVGVKNANAQTDGFMICLSDLPLIEPIEYRRLIDAFLLDNQTNKQPIVVPVYNGQRGNPVIFASYYKEEILHHKRKEGCRGVVKHNPQHVHEVIMDQDHVLKDIDTEEDYKKALSSSINDLSTELKANV